MKSRTFTDEVFGSQFVLLWAGTPEQFARHIRARYDKTYDGSGDAEYVGRCIEIAQSERHTIIIILPKWAGRRSMSGMSRDIATLAHECFHATELALRFRDIKHSDETSECFAYFLDSLVRRCLDILP